MDGQTFITVSSQQGGAAEGSPTREVRAGFASHWTAIISIGARLSTVLLIPAASGLVGLGRPRWPSLCSRTAGPGTPLPTRSAASWPGSPSVRIYGLAAGLAIANSVGTAAPASALVADVLEPEGSVTANVRLGWAGS